MNAFPPARALYLLRAPAETIASWVGEFGEVGSRNWLRVWGKCAGDAQIPFLRPGEATPERVAHIRALSAGVLELVDSCGYSWHNVGAAAYLWQNSFALNGLVGRPRIRLLDYADFADNPRASIEDLADWLGVRAFSFDPVRWHKGRGARMEGGAASAPLLARCVELYERIRGANSVARSCTTTTCRTP